MDEPIRILGQVQELKSLRIEGGWRLTIDLFPTRQEDIIAMLPLVNEQATVNIEIEEIEANK